MRDTSDSGPRKHYRCITNQSMNQKCREPLSYVSHVSLKTVSLYPRRNFTRKFKITVISQPREVTEKNITFKVRGVHWSIGSLADCRILLNLLTYIHKRTATRILPSHF